MNGAGNGSLMRLAPIPMWYAGDPRSAYDSSRTTHGAEMKFDTMANATVLGVWKTSCRFKKYQ